MTTETKIQMRFADTDMLGHVNNVNLQHYFDLGKGDYFVRVLRLSPPWITQGWIQKATSTVYEAQSRLAEPLTVRTKLEKIGTKSITLYQELVNPETGELKAYSTSVLVAFDFQAQRSIPLPEAWREALTGGPETDGPQEM